MSNGEILVGDKKNVYPLHTVFKYKNRYYYSNGKYNVHISKQSLFIKKNIKVNSIYTKDKNTLYINYFYTIDNSKVINDQYYNILSPIYKNNSNYIYIPHTIISKLYNINNKHIGYSLLDKDTIYNVYLSNKIYTDDIITFKFKFNIDLIFTFVNPFLKNIEHFNILKNNNNCTYMGPFFEINKYNKFEISTPTPNNKQEYLFGNIRHLFNDIKFVNYINTYISSNNKILTAYNSQHKVYSNILHIKLSYDNLDDMLVNINILINKFYDYDGILINNINYNLFLLDDIIENIKYFIY